MLQPLLPLQIDQWLCCFIASTTHLITMEADQGCAACSGASVVEAAGAGDQTGFRAGDRADIRAGVRVRDRADIRADPRADARASGRTHAWQRMGRRSGGLDRAPGRRMCGQGCLSLCGRSPVGRVSGVQAWPFGKTLGRANGRANGQACRQECGGRSGMRVCTRSLRPAGGAGRRRRGRFSVAFSECKCSMPWCLKRCLDACRKYPVHWDWS